MGKVELEFHVMDSAGRSGARSAWTLALGALSCLALGLTGCFSPDFGEGGFHCDINAGASACPEGYRCVRQPEDDFVCSTEQPWVTLDLLDTVPVARGGKLRFRLTVGAFELREDLVGKEPLASMGHAHVFVDTDAAGWLTVKRAGVHEIDVNEGPGEHDLIAILVQNNHTPLQPEVADLRTFTVKIALP